MARGEFLNSDRCDNYRMRDELFGRGGKPRNPNAEKDKEARLKKIAERKKANLEIFMGFNENN